MENLSDIPSEKRSTKKIIVKIITAILYIVYIAVCIVVVLWGTVIIIGRINNVVDFYGVLVVLVIILLGILLLPAPYLMKRIKFFRRFKFTKKSWARVIVSFFLIIIYIAIWAAMFVGESAYFKEFTKEKWMEFPAGRHMMLEDLKDNHGLIGASSEEVIALLGEPDSRYSDEQDLKNTSFTYSCSEDDFWGRTYLEISFNDGKVDMVNDFIYG